MRHIHIEEGLRLRFPHRSEDFDLGVEIGMLAVLMDLKTPQFERWIATSNRSQAQALAEQFGYRVTTSAESSDWVQLAFYPQSSRPQLRLAALDGHAL